MQKAEFYQSYFSNAIPFSKICLRFASAYGLTDLYNKLLNKTWNPLTPWDTFLTPLASEKTNILHFIPEAKALISELQNWTINRHKYLQTNPPPASHCGAETWPIHLCCLACDPPDFIALSFIDIYSCMNLHMLSFEILLDQIISISSVREDPSLLLSWFRLNNPLYTPSVTTLSIWMVTLPRFVWESQPYKKHYQDVIKQRIEPYHHYHNPHFMLGFQGHCYYSQEKQGFSIIHLFELNRKWSPR